MRIKLLLAALTLSFSAGAMADTTTNAINAAKDAKKIASKLGFEWRDMGKLIKKAEGLAKEGKDEKAIQVANVVSGQLDAIKKQAAIAAKAGPRF